jgi:hypothetical protein
MSTQLPKSLRVQVMDEWRDPDTGLVKCAHCLQQFPDTEIQIDHRHPEHLGGGHEKANLQPLCYPKVGPSCHKEKSAAEAAARALVRAKAGRSPLALPLSGLCAAAAAATGWAAWRAWQGQSIEPVIDATGTTVAAWLALSGLAWLTYFVANVGPGKDEVLKAATAKGKTGETPQQRIAAALRQEMGDKGRISVRKATHMGLIGYRCTYAGTNFPDHDDASKLKVQKRLSAKLGERQRLDWEPEADRLFLSPRPQLPARIDHPGIDKTLPWHLIPIAPSTTINLKVTPHVLIIGTTSAGKTSIFRSAIVSLAPAARREEVRLLLLDPKYVELVGFRGWPGVMDVLTDDEDLYNAPMEVEAEMRRRMRLFEQEKVPLSSHVPWIVVIDEYHEYVKRMGKWSLKNGKRKTLSAPIDPVEAIQSIAAMARRMGIHLIIGTQRPDAKWFGGDTRDLFKCCIGVGPLSPDAGRMLFKDGSQGRDIPMEAKGRFTILGADNVFVEDQSYWVPDPTDADGTNTEADWALLERLGMPSRAA